MMQTTFSNRSFHFPSLSGRDKVRIERSAFHFKATICFRVATNNLVLMGIFNSLYDMRLRVWRDVREAVLRLCWVELHNYDSISKGIFSSKLEKISGLLSHCSLERFSTEIRTMSVEVRSKNIEQVTLLLKF